MSKIVKGTWDHKRVVKKWEYDDVNQAKPAVMLTAEKTFVPNKRLSKSDGPSFSTAEKAKIEAATIIRTARNKAEVIEKEAYEQGFQQGEKAGLELGQKKVDPIIRQFSANLKELAHLKEIFWEKYHKEILQLIFAIAKKIMHREVALTPEIVFNVMQRAISEAVSREEIKVRINPDDYSFALQNRPELLKLFDEIKTLHFEKDETISQGGCIVETKFGDVDARLDRQLEELQRIFAAELGFLHDFEGK